MKNKKIFIIIGTVILIGAGIYFAVSRKPGVSYNLPAGERPFKGRADAAVIVDEYADFQCPACGAAVPYVKAFEEKYGANIRFNFKHFPLEQIHNNALNASLASECANDQGKFWEMHDQMYANQTFIDTSSLRGYAQKIGLDGGQFSACLDSKARLSIVRADQAVGNAIGINGTPTFVLNNKELLNLKDLEAAIRKELGLPLE